MIFQALRRVTLVAALALAASMPTASAQTGPIAMCDVYRHDVVEAAATGKSVVGDPGCGFVADARAGKVHYFATTGHYLAYEAAPEKYASTSVAPRKLAFAGADPVLYWSGPNGAADPQLGAFILGDPDKHLVRLADGTSYALASETTKAIFEANPGRYVAWAGDYCAAGAAEGAFVPGNPKLAIYVAGRWAVYGGEKSYRAALAMTETERITQVRAADYHHRRTFGPPAVAGVAGRIAARK